MKIVHLWPIFGHRWRTLRHPDGAGLWSQFLSTGDQFLACASSQLLVSYCQKLATGDAPCARFGDFKPVVDLPEATKPKGQWVQTERAAHEAWAALIAKAPKAAQVMHILTSRVGENNAVIISQKNLMALTGASRRTVQRALSVLEDDRWIEIRQVGQNGTVNAYVINDRVAWSGKRDGIRYSLFSATVVLSDDEQPDQAELGEQDPLRKLPSLFGDERQLPSGEGLPPPSQPDFEGMEQDLPAKKT